MSVIGEQIRRFRLQKGYTQEQLSREVGVTTQAVSNGSAEVHPMPRFCRLSRMSWELISIRCSEEKSRSFS